jgi:hypothetical protein
VGVAEGDEGQRGGQDDVCHRQDGRLHLQGEGTGLDSSRLQFTGILTLRFHVGLFEFLHYTCCSNCCV